MAENDQQHSPTLEGALHHVRTNSGRTIAEMSEAGRVLVVFLRCRGCPFCHEAMGDLRRQRGRIDAGGAQIVLVHQLPEAMAGPWLESSGLGGVPHICDPELEMFRAFDLGRGSPRALAGPKVWFRAIQAALAGHFVGRVVGDAMQMPGVFVVEDGRIVASHRHRTQADRPAYADLAAGAGA